MRPTRWYLKRDPHYADRSLIVVEERGGRRRGFCMMVFSRAEAHLRRAQLKLAVEALPPSGDARVVRTFDPGEVDG